MSASDTSTDADLARAAARGDARALEVLLGRHVELVHRVCRRVLGDPHDALDATQEALLLVTRRIGTYDGRAAFTTWLYRLATNAAIDEARRRSRRAVPVAALPEAAAPGASVEATVGEAVDVDALLATLPPEFRAAVALRDVVGLDYAHIAAVLDIPPGTVRSRIARGRALLAAHLGNPDASRERPTDGP